MFLCRCVVERLRSRESHFNGMKMHRFIPRSLYYYKVSINTAIKLNHSLSLEYCIYFLVPKVQFRKMIFRVPKIRSSEVSYYPKFG